MFRSVFLDEWGHRFGTFARECINPKLDCIDRMDKGRVRCRLVEAVRRFLEWQPGWKAAYRMPLKLADGRSRRKKTVIALGRQLGIDR